MNWIISEKFIRYSDGKAIVLANIGMDSTADLPETNAFEGRLLEKGSVAHDIDTGDCYCLNSSGGMEKAKNSGRRRYRPDLQHNTDRRDTVNGSGRRPCDNGGGIIWQ